MSLTLKEAITATQTTVDVNGTDALSNGDLYTIEAEQVFIVTASAGTLQPGETAWQRLSVQRGVLGTTEVGHSAGTAMTAVEIPLGAGGPVEQTILSRTTTLTDAQIKALPGTSVEVVPAPGAGMIVVPLVALLFLTRPTTYTNVDAGSSVNLVWPGVGDATIYITGPSLLGSNPSFCALHGASFDNGGSQYAFAFESVVNAALQIDAGNGALGDFTGGGAGNSLKVQVLYSVLEV
jgi:hypothetical protein